ncbi:hypothetical protein SprV_0501818000 [Sparganum proliferum]
MYSVVQFVSDDSVAVAAKACFLGDHLVAWPKDSEMQRLLEANRRPSDGAKLYEVKVLKDGPDLDKARRLAKKAEDTDNLSSSEPAALGRGVRTKLSMDENIPPLQQLLLEIKQEMVSQRKKMDFLSEEVIWLKTNIKDIKAMLADNRRTLETVSFVSKEKPPLVQLPLRTADAYEDFVSKIGSDHEIAQETEPAVDESYRQQNTAV